MQCLDIKALRLDVLPALVSGPSLISAASVAALDSVLGMWDFTQSLYVETGSQTTAASVDGPVGSILDISGNNNTATAPSDSARPTLRTGGVLELDGSDDAVSLPITANGVNIYLAMRSSDDVFTFLRGTSYFAADTNRSGSSTDLSLGCGTPTYAVNGTTFAGTTVANLSNAISTGNPVVFEVRDIDLAGGSALLIGDYPGYAYAGDLIGGIIVSDTATETAGERALIQQWLAQQSGAVLA